MVTSLIILFNDTSNRVNYLTSNDFLYIGFARKLF